MSTAAVVASTCCRECECYCGTLCAQCGYSCVAVDATACISKEEYEANVGSLPGTGSGAVISVGGAYYFFDGTTAACTGRINSNSVDWDISFLADACPETDVDPITVTLAFVGGWNYANPFTVNVDATGIADYTGCGDCAGDSAPTLVGAGITFTNTSTSGIETYYGNTSNFTGAASGGGTMCSTSEDAIEGGTCAYDGAFKAWANEIAPQLEVTDDGSLNVGELSIVNACGVDYDITITHDADGYCTFCVDTTCCCKFIGPASHWVTFLNSVYAGSGLTFSIVGSDDWFVGAKVRGDFVGTVDQGSFPHSSFSPSTLTVLASSSSTVTVSDYEYANIIGAFHMTGETTSSCPTCGAGSATGCGGWGDATATHPSGESSAGHVRERYGVDLAPAEWTWMASGSIVAGADCALTGADWTVT